MDESKQASSMKAFELADLIDKLKEENLFLQG